MGLTRSEMETIILFNEEEKTARVYTCNGKLKRKLAELVQSRPEEATLDKQDNTGAATYIVPKKWIKVNAGRILSDEHKEILTARLKSISNSENA